MSDDMTVLIQRLRQLLRTSTPGPLYIASDLSIQAESADGPVEVPRTDADRRLIVTTINHLPQLLDALEKQG